MVLEIALPRAIVEIPWLNLFLSYLIIIIPLLILYYYQTKLVLKTLIATARMTVQLLLLGLYLEYVFIWNHPLLTLAWITIMMVVSTITIIQKSDLKLFAFFSSVFISIVISILSVSILMLWAVLEQSNPITAEYFIPIAGMILGNCLQSSVIGYKSFYDKLRTDELQYKWALASGATRREALFPFKRHALYEGINPTIAFMENIGLISIPGMMTGQILGGNSPMNAIKYQIMIMLGISVVKVLVVYIGLWLNSKTAFDEFDMLKPNIRKGKLKK